MNNEKLTANGRARLWILAGLAGLSVALVLVSEAKAANLTEREKDTWTNFKDSYCYVWHDDQCHDLDPPVAWRKWFIKYYNLDIDKKPYPPRGVGDEYVWLQGQLEKGRGYTREEEIRLWTYFRNRLVELRFDWKNFVALVREMDDD